MRDRDKYVLFPTGNPNLHFDILYKRDRPGTGSYGQLYGYNRSEQPEPLTLVVYTQMILTHCDVKTQYVDSLVGCSRAVDGGDLACSVTRMRRTPEPAGPRNLTALDISWTNMLIKYIPYTLASMHVATAGILEKWLRDPPAAFHEDYIYDAMMFNRVSINVFSDRLALILNTHLRASLNATINVGSDGTSLDIVDEDWANTTGTWTEFTSPIYHVNWTWLSLYLISAIVVSVCAIANLVLRSNNVPDIFTGVSALTRDSPFFDIPTPASTLDGPDRARLLKDKWVMIQDVRPNDEVGRIAFSDAETLVSLKKDRLYT
ncbi:hypothetical protein NX059_005068 [Plenodomus lindquistii]|nr:hypothetical protein NX059_005068 [Plenodomus lindquistii]